jgi:hypothetical protein
MTEKHNRPHIYWDERDSLLIKVSNRIGYEFEMASNADTGRVIVHRVALQNNTKEKVGSYISKSIDAMNLEQLLLRAVRKHTGVDYGCEDGGE